MLPRRTDAVKGFAAFFESVHRCLPYGTGQWDMSWSRKEPRHFTSIKIEFRQNPGTLTWTGEWVVHVDKKAGESYASGQTALEVLDTIMAQVEQWLEENGVNMVQKK